MNMVPPRKNDCPRYQTVSEVYDGVCCDPDVIAHVRTCPLCGRSLKQIEDVDRILKKNVADNTPDYIGPYILEGVKKALAAPAPGVSPRKFKLFHIATRAAAILVIGLVFAYYIGKDYNLFPKPVPEKISPVTVQNSAAVPSVLSAPVPFRVRSGIDISDISSVSFGNAKKFLSNGYSSDGYAEINSPVRQIWTVPLTQENVVVALRKLLVQAGVSPSVAKMDLSEGGVHLRIEGTKLQIIRFVRECAKNGFRLLSPTQPQPEQRTFSGNAQDLLFYSANFIDK